MAYTSCKPRGRQCRDSQGEDVRAPAHAQHPTARSSQAAAHHAGEARAAAASPPHHSLLRGQGYEARHDGGARHAPQLHADCRCRMQWGRSAGIGAAACSGTTGRTGSSVQGSNQQRNTPPTCRALLCQLSLHSELWAPHRRLPARLAVHQAHLPRRLGVDRLAPQHEALCSGAGECKGCTRARRRGW